MTKLNIWRSNNPKLDDLRISNYVTIEAVKPTTGYDWLGFHLSYSDKVSDLVQKNLDKKLFNICKFYNWLYINETTPIKLKINVLYSCMFESFLYNSEAWGNIEHISEKLLKHERTALKRILCVKQSTPDDIVYCEVMRPDIKSIILERQYNLLQKLLSLTENEAITKRTWSYYCQKFKQNSGRHCHYNHYTKLQPDAKKKNMDRRKRRVANSDQTMCNRYRSLCSIDNQSLIYSHMINDRYRITLTRW